jgi:hypothetical protein
VNGPKTIKYNMNKTYLVEELFEDIEGDPDNIIFKIPPEICELQGWKEGDTMHIEATDGQLIIKKV